MPNRRERTRRFRVISAVHRRFGGKTAVRRLGAKSVSNFGFLGGMAELEVLRDYSSSSQVVRTTKPEDQRRLEAECAALDFARLRAHLKDLQLHMLPRYGQPWDEAVPLNAACCSNAFS